MANSTIEQFLPQTASYINWVFESDGKSRGGHHNYVVEQNCINSEVPLIEKTKKELDEYDEEQLKYLRQLDNNPNCVLIISRELYDDYATIVDIYGQGCNYTTKKGVENFQVDFEVIAFRDGESEKFHVVYQNTERNERLKYYSGFEMSRAVGYGCDTDESRELEEYMDYADGIFDQMESIAEQLCEKWFSINYED